MSKSQDFFERLLHADDEETVVEILNDEGYSLDSDVWVDLGQNEANFTVVGAQADNPTSAMVEKIVNSIDAVLTAECHRKGIDPKGPDAPPTMNDAVRDLFNVPKGRIDQLTPSEHTALAENIQIIASGSRSTPCYAIVDRGEGQTPDAFPDTFLSTTRSSAKRSIPFVQGRFNAGGTATLQFCGKQNLQLIVSKRCPDAPTAEGDNSADEWGFTIIRRRRSREGSVFVYLAPNGDVPRFKAESINVLPSKSKAGQPAGANAEPLSYGTCVKMYNYRWTAKSIATTEARRALEQVIQTPALPFRISETRSYKANYYQTTVIGIWNQISVDNGEQSHKNVEPGFPASADVTLRDVGALPMQIVVWKSEVKARTYPTGVYFLRNGQVHGQYTGEFISRKLKFDYIKDHLFVAVDCTNIDEPVAEDIFMASRDRMRKNDEYTEIREALAEQLKDHQGLKDLNARRRHERRESAQDSKDDVADLMKKLLRNDPGFALFLDPGSQLLTSTGAGPAPPFKGRQFPTFFEIEKGGKSKPLVKRCPVNRSVKVVFDTDAVNDYFQRAIDPGLLEVDPSPDLIEQSNLWNGKFTMKFRVPWDAKPGDSTKVRVRVRDVMREAAGPFTNEFELVATEAVDRPISPPGPRQNNRRNPNPRSDHQQPALAIPDPEEVKKDKLEAFGFSDQQQAILIRRSDDSLDFFINVDHPTLVTEMANKKNDPLQIKHWFKWGLTISALGMIRNQEIRNKAESSDENDEPLEVDLEPVIMACDGLARVIIPIIRSLYDGPESS